VFLTVQAHRFKEPEGIFGWTTITFLKNRAKHRMSPIYSEALIFLKDTLWLTSNDTL